LVSMVMVEIALARLESEWMHAVEYRNNFNKSPKFKSRKPRKY